MYSREIASEGCQGKKEEEAEAEGCVTVNEVPVSGSTFCTFYGTPVGCPVRVVEAVFACSERSISRSQFPDSYLVVGSQVGSSYPTPPCSKVLHPVVVLVVAVVVSGKLSRMHTPSNGTTAAIIV